MKRVFDICVAGLGLLVLSPLLVAIAVLVKLDSSGPVLFIQERIGRNFQPFRIYKFRTMVAEQAPHERKITIGTDPRITPFGCLLRKTKLDELPQLLNVVKGDMSFVGPRPEVREYVELFPHDYAEILCIRPGITDLASLKYRHESELLGGAENPEEEYVRRVLPEKIALAKEYCHQASLLFDVSLIVRTLVRLIR